MWVSTDWSIFSKRYLIDEKYFISVSSFTTYPIQPVRDELQTTSVQQPTITPKYDSTAMSTVIEWHVSLRSIRSDQMKRRKSFFFFFFFEGKKDVRVCQRARPIITDDSDAIIHVTSSTICGSDLHMCTNIWLDFILTLKTEIVSWFFEMIDNGDMKGMKAKDIIGHECKWLVDESEI